MEDFKVESRYMKLCYKLTSFIRWMEAAFYRQDFQKLLMCVNPKTWPSFPFKTCSQASGTLSWAFQTLSQDFESLRENRNLHYMFAF